MTSVPVTLSLYHGRCLCGAVQLEVQADLKAAAQLYCHCGDCTRWKGGAVDSMSLFLLTKQNGSEWPSSTSAVPSILPLRITTGQDKVRSFTLAGRMYRHWCDACGSDLYNVLPWANMIALFPGTFRGSGLTFQPGLHINYASRLVDDSDDVAKFNDLPSSFGGSDKQLTNDGKPVAA